MTNFIPIEKLVSKSKIKFLEGLENSDEFITDVKVRDTVCKYVTNSKRTLWQAVGIEFIEPDMLDYIDEISIDDILYDIGASNGIFSVYASQRGLNVYAFEPEAQNFSLLGFNAYLNKTTRHQLKFFNIALGRGNTLNKMYIAKFEAGGHMKILGKPLKVGELDEFIPDFVQNVMSYKLDSFIEFFNLPQPNHIKIDVDGSEYDVFEGAKKTLLSPELKSVFIELEENNKHTTKIINGLKKFGLVIKRKTQVQNYQGLHNFIFERL